MRCPLAKARASIAATLLAPPDKATVANDTATALANPRLSASDFIKSQARAKLQQLVEEAHTVCPYSKATKGNIPVKLTVV